MNKPNAKIKTYLINKKNKKTKSGHRRIDPNRIIPCFFLETGKPNFEFLPNCEQLVQLAHYSWPRNSDTARVFRGNFQTGILQAIIHLQNEWGFNIVAVKFLEDKRVHYGFTRKLELQLNSLVRKEKSRDALIKRAQQVEAITDPKALKLIESKGTLQITNHIDNGGI
jgi:hypothetical protein